MRPAKRLSAGRHLRFLDVPMCLVSGGDLLSLLARRVPDAPFAYVVTPNVDHVVRVGREGEGIRNLYNQAWLSVCDSQILRRLAGFLGVDLPLNTGSDLTRAIFEQVLTADDRITIIGCAPATVAILQERYPGLNIAHYDPPMGFIGDEVEVERVVQFIVDHPARFVFLAVGSPRQEIVALRVRQRDDATGLGLCIGNSLNFLAFPESRSPRWVSRLHLEWLHRLMSDPARLWRRYLVDNPAIFAMFIKALIAGRAIEPTAGTGEGPGSRGPWG
ncbi:MAG: WecB/TagA/CpsF family glycosyltransferase [Rhodospirillales bacterium]